MEKRPDAGSVSGKDQAIELLQAELARLRSEMEDITNKLKTSQSQVDALNDRNAALVGEVHRIEAALEATPRLTIKETYSEALNTQQRLLTIRGQVGNLQMQEQTAQHIQSLATKIIEFLRMQEPQADRLEKSRDMLIRVIDAQEEEREWLARAMHDGPAQSLTNFILQAEIALRWLDQDPEKSREHLIRLKQNANEVFQKVRGFIFDLRPMMLGDLGLVPTLRRYLSDLQTKSGIETTFEVFGSEYRLVNYLEVLIFRGISALVADARAKRGATNVRVNLDINDEMIKIVVEDNGKGYGTGMLVLDAAKSEEVGMSTLQERVNLVGGSDPMGVVVYVTRS